MKKQTTSCGTEGCYHDSKGRKYCSSCRKKQSREKDPFKYSLDNLRDSAAKRDIFFDLTLEQFKEFCYKTEYMKGKGRTIGSYNVDRIIEGKFPGYTYTNIQCLDKSKNVRKYFDWVSKKVVSEPIVPEVPKEDLPF